MPTATLDQLKPWTNVRFQKNYNIEEFESKLTIDGKGQKLLPMLVKPQDEDGKYPVWDGMRSLATLQKMASAGVEILPIPIEVAEPELAANDVELKVRQITLGTSGETLKPYEVATGVVEVVNLKIQELMAANPKLTQIKATGLAKKFAQEKFGVTAEVIHKHFQFVNLPDLLKEATYDGTIGGLYDAVNIHSKFKGIKDYEGTLEDFFQICIEASHDRKAATVTADDGLTAKLRIEQEIKQAAVRAKLQQQELPLEQTAAIETALDTGVLSAEVLEEVAEESEAIGVPLENVIERAQDSASEVTLPGGQPVITNEDLKRATKRTVVDQAHTSLMDETTDETLIKQAFDMSLAIMIFNIGENPGDAIDALKERLDQYSGGFIEDFDREALVDYSRVLQQFYERTLKIEEQHNKRQQKAATA